MRYRAGEHVSSFARTMFSSRTPRIRTAQLGTMFLIFGTRGYQTLLVLVSFICPHCGVDAHQRVSKVATKFTLFFVPLFTVSTKHFVDCTNCGARTALTKEQAQHSLEWARS